MELFLKVREFRLTMIKNNKGAILLITVVSMMILTIIGYITLQMVSSQGVMDTYAQTKVRVDYAAEAIVERARGYIDYYTRKYSAPETAPMSVPGGIKPLWGDVGRGGNAGNGMLFSIVSDRGRWFMLEDTEDNEVTYSPPLFDDTMYPNVSARVYCEAVTGEVDGFSNINDTPDADGNMRKTYRIVGVASANVDTADGSLIVSTVTCYFYTKKRVIGTDDDFANKVEITNHIRGWRKS